jgi:ligand-binding sensor domain-containing protein
MTALAGPRVAEVLTAAGQVRDVLPVGDALWLATAGGLVRASEELVEDARFTTLDGLPSVDCWALAAAGEHLYVATPGGVIAVRLDEGRPAGAQLYELPKARALAMVGGVLWAGTWGGGVVRWDGAHFVASPLIGAQVNRLVAEGRHLWAATAQGLARLDGDSVRWWRRQEGLPDDFVWDVSEGLVQTMAGPARLDGERLGPEPGPAARRLGIPFGDGHLVVGDEGVSRLGPDGAARAVLQPLGLPSPDITALAVGEEALYVGSFDAGVAAVRREQGSLAIERIEGLIDARINALAVRRDRGVEELWVGTARGASRVREGKVTHFTVADGLPDDHVNAIVADGERVRLVTNGGWAEVGPSGVTRVTPESGLPVTRLQAMARAGDGALWVGGARGLARLEGDKWSTARALTGELPDDFVTALAAAGDDLWVGTYSSGLARRVGRRWIVLREPELPSNWINQGALAFWRDRIWGGTVERGLMISPRQRPGEDEGRWTSLGVADGLPSADVTALAADEDGLWVGTRGGVARVVMPVVVGGRQ